MTTHFKLSDQKIVLLFFAINLILAVLTGYLDEGINSFQFLFDASSLLAVLTIAILLTSLPLIIYFIGTLFKLKKSIKLGLSFLLQSMTIIFIIILF